MDTNRLVKMIAAVVVLAAILFYFSGPGETPAPPPAPAVTPAPAPTPPPTP